MSKELRGGHYDHGDREEPRLDLRIEPPPVRRSSTANNPYDARGERPGAQPAGRPAGQAYPGRQPDPLDDDGDFSLPPSYAASDYGREDYGRDDDYYDEEPRRRTRWAPIAIAALALIGFAAVIWYAYDWGSGGQQGGLPPVIQADNRETKVKPESEGGIQVQNQDATILNPNAPQPATEVLLPPPEEPVTPPPAPAPVPAPAQTATAPEADLEPGMGEGTGAIEGALPEDELVAAAPPSPPPAPEAAPPQPAAPAPAPAQPAPAQPAAPEAAAPAPAPAPTEGQSAGAPESLVPAPPPAPAPQPAQSLAPSDFLIQLASLTSPEAARTAWGSLQGKYPGLLGDMQLFVQEINIDGKGKFYRVQAGPLPNRATADDLCGQLKAQKQDCIVVKR